MLSKSCFYTQMWPTDVKMICIAILLTLVSGETIYLERNKRSGANQLVPSSSAQVDPTSSTTTTTTTHKPTSPSPSPTLPVIDPTVHSVLPTLSTAKIVLPTIGPTPQPVTPPQQHRRFVVVRPFSARWCSAPPRSHRTIRADSVGRFYKVSVNIISASY